MFFTAIDATRNLAPRGCIIVGIGYPTDSPEFAAKITGLPGRTEDGAPDPRTVRAAIQMLRNHDLTLPATTDFVARRPGYGITVDNVGGADTFIDVLIREIRPLVESLAPVAPGNQALFGHSFGGLVVLRALFRRPEAFRSFIAASPSIYWNDFAVLADEPAYSKRVRSGEITPRVLITVGGAESDLAPSAGPEQVAQVRLKRTVASAVGLAARLSALPGRPPYVTQGVVFDGEGHVSTQQAAMSRGVAFAFQDDRNAD
jgi:pimeloyl-ACP methyl ester carboxylesterase